MVPSRSLPPCLTSRLTGLASIILLAGAVGLARADRLPVAGTEMFRDILGQDSKIPSDDPPTMVAQKLAAYQQRLRDAGSVRHLSSLGEMTRILLLPDWGTSEFSEPDTNVSLTQVEKVVANRDADSFKREVQRLLQMASDKSTVVQMIADEIKRDVRLSLLQRLEYGSRQYLRAARAADRIAIANLIAQTMTDARKQGNPEVINAIGGAPKTAPRVSQFLRQRLLVLTGDIQKLTRDSDPQVQVAGVRALSELEIDPAIAAATLKPMLNPATNVVARRATAKALAHMVDLVYLQWKAENRSRPQPPLKALERLFPVAAHGLADSDIEVRRASILACQHAVTTLDDLIGDRRVPPGGLSVYNPLVTALQKSLPALNRSTKDVDPELRVAACRMLESLVVVARKSRHLEELPPEPKESLEPKKGTANEPNKGTAKGIKQFGPLSQKRRTRRPASNRPSQWAAARLEQPSQTTLLTPVPLHEALPTSAVTLDRPVRLSAEEQKRPALWTGQVVRPIAFVPPPIDELPAPAPVKRGLDGTLQAMIVGLRDPDFHVRQASVDVLETFGDRAAPAIPALVGALADPNKFVRWASARTLGHLAPRQSQMVVPGLMRLLNDREDMSVRITAAYALEQYGPDAKAAVPLLARVLNRGDKEYILAILHTIGGIGTDAKPALPSVAWIMRNRALATSVRVEAAQTLGRFGPLAGGQLGELRRIMVNDPNADVRNAASSAVLAIELPK